MFYAFRYPGFRWLWAGSALSSAAQWMHITTLGWVAFDMTGSAVLLGTIIAAGNLVSPFVSPFGGLAADRFKRNHIIAVTQMLLLANAALLAVALIIDAAAIWMLFAFALGASVLNGVNMPTRQAMVFDVVPREVGPNAIALSNLAMNVMRTGGPSIGAALIVLFGPEGSFIGQSVVYLLVMVTVLRIQIAGRPAGASRRTTFFRDTIEGYRWVLGNSMARMLLLLMAIYPLFIIPVHTTTIVIFADEVFDYGAGGLGILHSALGVGGIAGGFLVASLNRMERRGLLQLFTMIACGGFLSLFAIAGGFTGMFWLGVVTLIGSGVGGAMYNITNQTLVQLIAPDHLRGRVTAVLQMQPLFMAIGIFITGVITEFTGAVTTGIGLGILAVGTCGAVFLFSPQMRRLRLSELMAAQEKESAGVEARAAAR